MKAKYEADAAMERYLELNISSKFSSIGECNYYAEACKELAFILKHAYSVSPKCLQSLMFEDVLAAFCLLPLFPMQMQSVVLGADTLLQTAESVLPKKKKVLAVAAYKHAKVAWKRRVKAQEEEQGLGVAQLPEDVLQLVFSHLDLRSLAYAEMVCRSWCAAAREDHIWKSLYFNFFRDSKKQCLRYGIQTEGTVANGSQNDIVNTNSIDWREAFKEMYKRLASKKCMHYRGYCRSCNMIVWLNDAKCYKKHIGKDSLHRTDAISINQIVEYVLDGNLPSECSSDSDTEDSGAFRMWDMHSFLRMWDPVKVEHIGNIGLPALSN